MSGFIAKANCMAMDDESMPCIAKMLKSEMQSDVCGHYWCPEHRNRGDLLNWAAQHDYPTISFRGHMRYAIGVDGSQDNKMFWEVAIQMGKEDMINAAIAYINSHWASESEDVA